MTTRNARSIYALNSQYFVLIIQNWSDTKTHSILTSDLWFAVPTHLNVWRFWFGGRSNPKFFIQSNFYMFKKAVCRLWVGDLKKINIKSFFTGVKFVNNVWDGHHILYSSPRLDYTYKNDPGLRPHVSNGYYCVIYFVFSHNFVFLCSCTGPLILYHPLLLIEGDCTIQ